MKKVAILQSNYIPWKGYFDLIAAVDEFILLNDVQFTKRDWRNRNKIKTQQGLKWLTVPVQVKGKYHQKICDTFICDGYSISRHWSILEENYKKAPCYDEVKPVVKPLYFDQEYKKLADLNRFFIESIADYLGINTLIVDSLDYDIVDGKSERLVSLCMQSEASHYITGPAASNYIEQSLFRQAGIDVEYFDYSGYRHYPQLWGGFEHKVSILDLLFNCGSKSFQYMKYVS